MLLTVIAFPAKSRSLLPVPVYVPGATITVSPLLEALIAACIVAYSLGTFRSTAMAMGANRMIPVNTIAENTILFIFVSSKNDFIIQLLYDGQFRKSRKTFLRGITCPRAIISLVLRVAKQKGGPF